jgi:membrane-bound lytic murein transglycosylase A
MMRVRLAAGLAIFGAISLAACAPLIPTSEEPLATAPLAPIAGPENAVVAGVARGPSVGALRFTAGDAGTALASFLDSCPELLRREDRSGLTHPDDWRDACNAATDWPLDDARRFFIKNFETARVNKGEAFATGYFEPEIGGCRTRQPGCEIPIYRAPPELVRAWPEEVPEEERNGQPLLGRYDASDRFIPFYERAEIEDGALSGRGLELAWAADPVELFFLQIQGSGRIRTPDEEIIRIGYAGQNGREYIAIGRVMRERGLLGDEPGQYAASMQGIMQYLREHPDDGRELMRLNKSWIFFRELMRDGPLGSLGVPVRRETSVAVDPRFVPMGAPVWLDLERNEADGLWVAQDTGGAIKGANRFDTFWGAGSEAREIAGGMSSNGKALILLPKGTVARLKQRQ